MTEPLAIQAGNLVRKISPALSAGGVKGVNAGAAFLLGLAIKAAEPHTAEARKGKVQEKRLGDSLRLTPAKGSGLPATATVWIDGKDQPRAPMVHENYNGVTIRPRLAKFLFIPLTAEGGKHELHAHDVVQKRLKGWISSEQKHWPGQFARQNRPLDFILLESVTIGPSRYAGFLTKTFRDNIARIEQKIMQTVWDAVNKLRTV
jgi:hypothetical protein